MEQEKITHSSCNMTLDGSSSISYPPLSTEQDDAQEVFTIAARNGFQCYHEKKYAESLVHFARALRQNNHAPLRVKAEILIAISNLHSLRKDTIKSIHALQLSLEMLMACFGPKSAPVAMVLQKLASEYAILKEPETAVECLCEALAIALANKSTSVCSIWRALGQQLMTLGLSEDAQTCFEEARTLSVEWIIAIIFILCAIDFIN